MFAVIRSGSYAVVALRVEDRLVPPPEGAAATQEVEVDRVFGHAGCNRYTGRTDESGVSAHWRRR